MLVKTLFSSVALMDMCLLKTVSSILSNNFSKIYLYGNFRLNFTLKVKKGRFLNLSITIIVTEKFRNLRFLTFNVTKISTFKTILDWIVSNLAILNNIYRICLNNEQFNLITFLYS